MKKMAANFSKLLDVSRWYAVVAFQNFRTIFSFLTTFLTFAGVAMLARFSTLLLFQDDRLF